MADVRAKALWAPAVSLMALLANCHRDPKKGRAARPQDFWPFDRQCERVPKVGIDVLKEVFIKGRVPQVK